MTHVFRNRTFRIVLLSLALGLASEFYLWQTRGNAFFLAVLAPVLAIIEFLESHFSFSHNFRELQNEFIFVLPLTGIYFILVGYWLGQILREDGFLKYFVLLCFLAFLFAIHWQAFGYLNSLVNTL